VFLGLPSLAGFAFTGYHYLAYKIVQVILDLVLPVAAVSSDRLWRSPGSVHDPRPTAGASCRRVGRVAYLDAVVDDDAVIIVGDLGFVAELDWLAQAALSDRAGIAIVKADPPSGAVGGDDLASRDQQFGQFVDRASAGGRVAGPLPRRARRGRRSSGVGPAHRPLGVDQQPLGVAGRGFGQLCQLSSAGQPRGPGLVAAQRGARAQFRGVALASRLESVG